MSEEYEASAAAVAAASYFRCKFIISEVEASFAFIVTCINSFPSFSIRRSTSSDTLSEASFSVSNVVPNFRSGKVMLLRPSFAAKFDEGCSAVCDAAAASPAASAAIIRDR